MWIDPKREKEPMRSLVIKNSNMIYKEIVICVGERRPTKIVCIFDAFLSLSKNDVPKTSKVKYFRFHIYLTQMNSFDVNQNTSEIDSFSLLKHKRE